MLKFDIIRGLIDEQVRALLEAECDRGRDTFNPMSEGCCHRPAMSQNSATCRASLSSLWAISERTTGRLSPGLNECLRRVQQCT